MGQLWPLGTQIQSTVNLGGLTALTKCHSSRDAWCEITKACFCLWWCAGMINPTWYLAHLNEELIQDKQNHLWHIKTKGHSIHEIKVWIQSCKTKVELLWFGEVGEFDHDVAIQYMLAGLCRHTVFGFWFCQLHHTHLSVWMQKLILINHAFLCACGNLQNEFEIWQNETFFKLDFGYVWFNVQFNF